MGFRTKHKGRKTKGKINGELSRNIFVLAVNLCVRWAGSSLAFLPAMETETVFHHSAPRGTGAKKRPDVARALTGSGYRGTPALLTSQARGHQKAPSPCQPLSPRSTTGTALALSPPWGWGRLWSTAWGTSVVSDSEAGASLASGGQDLEAPNLSRSLYVCHGPGRGFGTCLQP